MSYYRDYIPKSFTCWKEGYTKERFLSDLLAGFGVGIISLPLALAFAIGSGVAPEKGLFTAIVAGFLISFFGGSRVQIGGPTGAFVVIVYGIVQAHGYEGLAVATLLAGGMLILMGLARFGAFLRFIPYPVIVGFTTGLAFVIFVTQLKDFFGLQIDAVPPHFLEKCTAYCTNIHTHTPAAAVIATITLALLFFFKRVIPKWPGVIFAIAITTALASFLNLPLETIQSRFGEIPTSLPTPCIPNFSFDLVRTMFPDAITIALLAAIESLLCAVVADGMTGYRHRSNGELVSQGLANIGSIFFGGIPATGALARTAANIRMGATTPLAGMAHAVTLLLIMLFLAPLVSKIPLATLSAVLVYVAWNMSELPHFFEILKGPKSEALVLLVTFLLTVLIDITVAVQVGVVLAAFLFIKHLTDQTTLQASTTLLEEESEQETSIRKNIPNGVVVFEIHGPFFYSTSDLLNETLSHLIPLPHVFILRMHHVSLIDMTGVKALKEFQAKCEHKGILFLIAGASKSLKTLFHKTGLEQTFGKEHMFKDVKSAVAFAKQHLPTSS